IIIDVVRVPKFKEEKCNIIGNRMELNVFGLPYGLFLMKHLQRTYNKAVEQLGNKKYDLVHAHKLSFDGVVGYKLALRANVSLFLTIRQSDIAVMKYRPDLIPKYKKVLMYSSKIIHLVPCMIKFLKEVTGEDFFDRHIKSKIVFLPNIVERKISDVSYESENYFLTIARMSKDYVKIKNIKRLLPAFSQIKDKKVKLKIIGKGKYMPAIKKWVDDLGLNGRVEFLGAIDNTNIDPYYAKALAMVMPSKRESFGMVYAEALLNGTPIMYSKGVIGFEGVFNDCGVGVDPFSIDSIKNGLEQLIQNNAVYRRAIKELSNKKAFSIFSANSVREKYLNILGEILGKEQNAKVLS
ncbi:MAG: glycosyltransferase, partial [Bacteroidota bacterium]|nr:glycosyltransferase [Bacteroidota bacterium]